MRRIVFLGECNLRSTLAGSIPMHRVVIGLLGACSIGHALHFLLMTKVGVVEEARSRQCTNINMFYSL